MTVPLNPCRLQDRQRSALFFRPADKAFTVRVAMNWSNRYAVVLHDCPSGYETRAQRLASKLQARRLPNGDLLMSGEEANAFIAAYASNFD